MGDAMYHFGMKHKCKRNRSNTAHLYADDLRFNPFLFSFIPPQCKLVIYLFYNTQNPTSGGASQWQYTRRDKNNI